TRPDATPAPLTPQDTGFERAGARTDARLKALDDSGFGPRRRRNKGSVPHTDAVDVDDEQHDSLDTFDAEDLGIEAPTDDLGLGLHAPPGPAPTGGAEALGDIELMDLSDGEVP